MQCHANRRGVNYNVTQIVEVFITMSCKMKLITSASTYSFKLEMFRVHFAAGIESFPGFRKTKNGKLQMTIR